MPPPPKRKKLAKKQARKGGCFAKEAGATAAEPEEVDLGVETVECDLAWFSDANGTDDEVGMRPHVRLCALLARAPV